MKKLLTGIFSSVLIASTVATPAMAQLAKKAVATNAKTAKAMAMRVDAVPENAIKNTLKPSKDGFVAKTRSVGASQLKSAKKGHANVARKKFAAAPLKVAEGMPQINGCVIYSDFWTSANEVGVYALPKQAGATELLFPGPNATYGGACVDGKYYATDRQVIFIFQVLSCTAWDVTDGELVGEWQPSDLSTLSSAGYAQDPTTGTYYGITFTADGKSRVISTLTFGEGITATPVAPIEGSWNSVVIDSHGQMYGIRHEIEGSGDDAFMSGSTLCKIDKETGAVTEIGATGCIPVYSSNAIIDPSTDRMFWNLCEENEEGWMCEVNLATGETTPLYQLAGNEEIMGLYIPTPLPDKAPGECQDVELVFPEGSMNGSVNLTTPATFFDGTAGSGNLTICVTVNGEEVATASAAWGVETTVPVDLSDYAAGRYNIAVFGRTAEGDGPKTVVRGEWYGPDVPSATSAVLSYVNGNMEVTWNAVTTSVNGGYIDLDNLTYKVVRADGSVAAEGLTVTSFSEAVAEPEEGMVAYSYTVYVVAGNAVSAPANTNVVSLGSLTPPYTSNFAEDGLDGWTVIDANGDGKSWTAYQGEARVSYNSSLAMDDWLVSPGLKLEGGKVYGISFTSHSSGSSFPERLEVKYGKEASVSGMTSALVEPTIINSSEPRTFDALIKAETDGIYYVGFHGMSDADMFYLYVGDVTIQAGADGNAPASATNLEVEPDVNGALKAKVSFKTPSTTLLGAPLAGLDKVELLRNDEVIKTFPSPAVNTTLTYEDTLTEKGAVEYTVVAYNANGEGMPVSVSTYIGYQAPEAPLGVKVATTSTEGEVIVTWNAVTEDIAGLLLSSDKVTYSIYDEDENEIVSGLTSLSYTYQAVPAGEQKFVEVIVAAVVEGVTGAGTYSNMVPAGKPYDGLHEGVANGQLSYIWGLASINGGTVSLMRESTDIPSPDGDGYYFAIDGPQLNTGAMLFSGLVSLAGAENPVLSFYTFDITRIADDPEAHDVNEISVGVKKLGDTEYSEVFSGNVYDICESSDNGWGKVSIDLSDYANETIQFGITGVTRAYRYTVIDNIKAGATYDYDLSAPRITAPEKVKAGSDYQVDVTVVNEGEKAVNAYAVELYADEKLVATEDCGALASGASTTVTFDCVMSSVATEPVTYFAKIVYSADQYAANNQSRNVTVTPILSVLPAVVNLEAKSENEGVKLTWNEPELEGGQATQVTEDFEDADSFSAEYGNWTFVDGDQSEVGGFQNMDIPGINPGSTKGSFWIWDTSMLGNQTFGAHSGTKYLFSLFRYDDGKADDYAISPELTGEKQTISFYAKSYSTEYPEKIRVLYTTLPSVDPADYVEVMPAEQVPGEWTLYQVELPAGALHFAINSCATSSFMLMVDDVTFTPAVGFSNLEIAGYNVYRDGVKINDALVGDNEYLDTNVVDGETYTYVVKAVYVDRGESANSNAVVITYSESGVDTLGAAGVKVTAENGNVVIYGAEGKHVTVATLEGVVIYNGEGAEKTVVEAGKGVYVVSVDKVVKKLAVR